LAGRQASIRGRKRAGRRNKREAEVIFCSIVREMMEKEADQLGNIRKVRKTAE
jgi:hypothetical protein